MNTRSKTMTLLTLCLVLLAWLGTPVSTQAQGGASLQVYISLFPRLPSTQDFVSFYAFLLDDVSQTEVTYTWDFGDGTTASGQLTGHHYAAEGDYVVRLAVTTADGRSGSAARTITVRDRDVAVTKLTAPQAARAGQTRQVSVGVTSKRYDNWVSVILFKSDPSDPSGYSFVGELRQFVATRQSGRATAFDFTYTFTDADAQAGQVTFQVEADLDSAFDVNMSDNLAFSAPVKVTGVKAAAAAAPGSAPMLYLPALAGRGE
ncbi:MAG: PKD domain-containing protein [Caldilineaceae bacterium]